MPLPISIAIITLNEERNLARCLESVRDLAAEIIIIDSGSTDKTAEIAREFGAHFEVNPWPGYVAQKNIAAQRCSQPWVLSLDADEHLSTELTHSIRQLFAEGEPKANGYFVNRRNWYLGAWIWYAWYPEWRLRLARRDQAQWRGGRVHERLEVRGATARLTGDLLHYPFQSFHEHLNSAIQYAHMMADSYASEGVQFRWRHLLFSPWATFFKHLLFKQGFRDGWRGWLIACAKFINVFAKYAFLLEHERTTKK